MPTTTRQPTNRQTPDATLGGSAVTGDSNTGHSTTSGSAGDSFSCRWFGFAAAPAGTITVIRLKASHSSNGTVNGAGAFNTFKLSYSTNGGSNWTDAVSRGPFSTLQSSAIDVALLTTQDLTQVQVRDQATATVNDPETENATVEFSVSDIRIEVTTAEVTPLPDTPLVMLW